MKYYIIAGEASGDLHASNMMRAIKKNDPTAEFRCWGGDLMEAEGGVIIKHYKDLAFMGFKDVLLNLSTIFKNISFCKNDLANYQPDAVIFVDYPGFNLRIAKYAKEKLRLKTFYYISPTVWAWKANRANTVKKYIDKMFVILPFEQDFYQNYNNCVVDYVGHPLLDAVQNYKDQHTVNTIREEYQLGDKPLVVLMAGSRKREIIDLLPTISTIASKYPAYQFVIAGAPGQSTEIYTQNAQGNIPVIVNRTYDLLQIAHAAIVKSGTVTLETALFRVPQVIVYKGDKLSWWVAKNFLVKNLKYIGLVNLIMNEEIIQELLQENFTENNLEKAFNKILLENKRLEIQSNYQAMEKKLGGLGASTRVADRINQLINK